MTTDHPVVIVTFWVLFAAAMAYAGFTVAGIVEALQ